MTYIIYGLFDPRQVQAIRYIGFTARVDRRLSAHIAEAKKSKRNTHKLNWIRLLLSEGVTPEWKQLDSVEDLRRAAQREIELIQEYLDNGAALTNGTRGGDGSVLWTHSMHETRSHLSQDYWSKQGAREQQRQAMESHWSSPEGEAHRQQNIDANKRVHTGTKKSPDARAKMSAAKQGKPHARRRTPEWNAKIGDAQRGKKRRPWTEEERARHMAGMNREKMSASAKARKR
jgi:predicted GIY-YIG superfamily endonuclease